MNVNLTWHATVFGSAALLSAAFAFQYLGGLHPCELCIWQRWPHAIAVVLAVLFRFRGTVIIALAGAVTMLAGVAVAGFHVGVELQYWSGLSNCTGPSLVDLSGDQLLDLSAPLVSARCDEIAWSFMGISMAGWNGLLSTALLGLWLVLARSIRSSADAD